MVKTSVAVTTAGAFIEGDACEPIWRIVREEVARRQRDGGRLRPSVQRALDALRSGASAHLVMQQMFAAGHASGPAANMPTESIPTTPDLVTTQAMADRLHCTPTHARRLAAAAGIEAVTTNAWRATDVDALVLERKTA